MGAAVVGNWVVDAQPGVVGVWVVVGACVVATVVVVQPGVGRGVVVGGGTLPQPGVELVQPGGVGRAVVLGGVGGRYKGDNGGGRNMGIQMAGLKTAMDGGRRDASPEEEEEGAVHPPIPKRFEI